MMMMMMMKRAQFLQELGVDESHNSQGLCLCNFFLMKTKREKGKRGSLCTRLKEVREVRGNGDRV